LNVNYFQYFLKDRLIFIVLVIIIGHNYLRNEVEYTYNWLYCWIKSFF